jgi:acyl dehydratase
VGGASHRCAASASSLGDAALGDGRPVIQPLGDAKMARLPVYDWDVAVVGQEAPPLVFAVTDGSIADYCRAVRNDNPLYRDADTARAGPFGRIVAPPTYAFVCAPLRRHELMHAHGFAAPEEHGLRATPFAKADLRVSRPIRPGDVLTSAVRLDDRYERRGSQFLTFRVRAIDREGGPVVEYTYTVIWRQGPAARRTDAPPDLVPSVDAEHMLPVVRKVESQEAIDAYAELTRLWPPPGLSLHSDPDFARRSIFGGTVNLGMATMAYCSQVLEQAFGPAPMLRPGSSLEFKATRPIRAGDAIAVGGRVVDRTADLARCELWVHNQDQQRCGVATATVVFGVRAVP